MAEQKKKIPISIGMRNIKTAASVLICLLLYRFLPRDGSFLASTSAIICLQDSVEKSVFSGFNRLYGTAVGAVLGTVLLYINQFFASADLTIILATFGVMLLILLCNLLNKNESIVIGTVVFLLILLDQSTEPPVVYGFYRLIDTFIGIAVAIAVNKFLPSPSVPEPEKEVQGAEEPAGKEQGNK